MVFQVPPVRDMPWCWSRVAQVPPGPRSRQQCGTWTGPGWAGVCGSCGAAGRVRRRDSPLNPSAGGWRLSLGEGGGGDEPGWDPGPGTACCWGCPWARLPSGTTAHRLPEGPQRAVCRHSWGNAGPETPRPPRPRRPLLQSQEPEQGPAQDPCPQPHPEGGQSTQAPPPAGPLDPPLPSPSQPTSKGT